MLRSESTYAPSGVEVEHHDATRRRVDRAQREAVAEVAALARGRGRRPAWRGCRRWSRAWSSSANSSATRTSPSGWRGHREGGVGVHLAGCRDQLGGLRPGRRRRPVPWPGRRTRSRRRRPPPRAARPRRRRRRRGRRRRSPSPVAAPARRREVRRGVGGEHEASRRGRGRRRQLGGQGGRDRGDQVPAALPHPVVVGGLGGSRARQVVGEVVEVGVDGRWSITTAPSVDWLNSSQSAVAGEKPNLS